jgi:predicted nucleotidyltransferase
MEYGMRGGGDSAAASAFISRFTQWAQQEVGITAVALVGSFACGTATVDSDVDLVVIADDPASYLAEAAWADAFGSVERTKLEDWGAVQSLRVFYADGLEVEFGFASPAWTEIQPVDDATAKVIRDGAVILVAETADSTAMNPRSTR